MSNAMREKNNTKRLRNKIGMCYSLEYQSKSPWSHDNSVNVQVVAARYKQKGENMEKVTQILNTVDLQGKIVELLGDLDYTREELEKIENYNIFLANSLNKFKYIAEKLGLPYEISDNVNDMSYQDIDSMLEKCPAGKPGWEMLKRRD